MRFVAKYGDARRSSTARVCSAKLGVLRRHGEPERRDDTEITKAVCSVSASAKTATCRRADRRAAPPAESFLPAHHCQWPGTDEQCQ
jgi:hypothetical protein